MKKEYSKPELEIIFLASEAIMLDVGEGGEISGGFDVEDDW